MTKRAVPWWVALCLVVGSASHALADPTPLDATVTARAQALITGSPAQFQALTQSTDASLNPLTLSAYVEAHGNGDLTAAFTTIDAHWDSPSAGDVQFGESGFYSAAQNSTGSDSLDGSRWTYRFQPADDGNFIIDYDIYVTSDTTDPSGLQGIWFVVVLNGYLPVVDEVLPPNTTGQLFVPLSADETYAV